MLCDTCEGFKLCSVHYPGSPRCREMLQKHGWSPSYSRADRIRAMTDEELAVILAEFGDGPFCTKDPRCEADLNDGRGIPIERCRGCALIYLQQTAEEPHYVGH